MIRIFGQRLSLILAAILLLAGSVFGQARQEYSVSAFTGLNLATDSIDQAPGEAIQSDNVTLDKFGALHKRYGVINWNDSLISADTILDIHYVEDKNGDKMLFIATNNYIYEAKSWEDVDSMGIWDSLNVNGTGLIIDYTRGQIDTVNGNRIYGDTTGWILVAAPGDILLVGDSVYTIDTVLADTLIVITGSTNPTQGSQNTPSYRLLKSVSEPSLSSWNGNLYVADPNYHPWWYDGDYPYLLGIVDSGTVTGVVDVPDSVLVPYNTGTVWIYRSGNSRVSQGTANFKTEFAAGDTVSDVGNIFHLYVLIEDHPLHRFESLISGHSQSRGEIYLQRQYASWNFVPPINNPNLPLPGEIPHDPRYSDYTVAWSIEYAGTGGGSQDDAYIQDTSKSWGTWDWLGFLLINGSDATSRSYIADWRNDKIYYDTLNVDFSVGDRYYIVWQTPTVEHLLGYLGEDPGGPVYGDSVVVDEIKFSQMLFHKNRLYAIGYGVQGKDFSWLVENDTINTNRIWFADIGIPNYIPSDWNFDLSGARSGKSISIYSHDVAQRMFVLRDDVYVITNSNIYRILGEPDPSVLVGFDIFLMQVIHGVGTNQPNGVVTTKDNVAYIMNQQGIWYFDGNRIEKISYKVDPLVEQYRASRMVASKFKDDLFFSYPDSGVTIVMHYPTKGFTVWDIGMLTINDQVVAVDSNYFLFAQSEDSAYVLKYPRDFVNFSDILAPNDTSVVVFRYRPGWLTFGTLRDKVLEDIEITAFTINPLSGYDFLNYLAVYRDFTDTVRWSATAFSEGTPINAFESIGDDGAIHGRAFQILVKDSTDNDFWLSNYLLRWYDPTR